MARGRGWLCSLYPTWGWIPCTHFKPLPPEKVLHPPISNLTKSSFPKESTDCRSLLPRFACTCWLPATLLITHCSCKLIQLRETSLDDYKMLQLQYCFRPAESKFIKHLIFKAAVVINACLHLRLYTKTERKWNTEKWLHDGNPNSNHQRQRRRYEISFTVSWMYLICSNLSSLI